MDRSVETTPIQTILLTGATGVIGSHLLKRLLLETDTWITCLVRKKGASPVENRLLQALRYFDPERRLDEVFQSRVQVHEGDVSQENLGLPEDQCLRLAQETDLVIHGAANTNLLSNYSKVKKINVDGTRNVIQFALQTQQKRLHFLSTYAIVGDKAYDPSVAFRETDYDIGQRFESHGYHQTKFEAEGMIRNTNDLRWTIFRLGNVFGESGTGNYPYGVGGVSQIVNDLFKTVIETGVIVESHTHYDVTPVDYVSQAIIQLGLRSGESTLRQTFHLMNPDVKTFHDSVNILRSLGYPIKTVSEKEYKEMIAGGIRVQQKPYNSLATLFFKTYYKKMSTSYAQGARTCSEMTTEELKKRNVHCPKIDRKLLGTYVSRILQQEVKDHDEN